MSVTTTASGSSLNEVFPPGWIVSVRLAPDLDVAPDRYPAGVLEPNHRRLTIDSLPDAEESPVPSSVMAPVFLLNPTSTLGRVFPACPLPKTGEDGGIYFAEDAAADSVPM